MSRDEHTINEVGESVAVLMTKFEAFSKDFQDFKKDNKEFCESTTKRVSANEDSVLVINAKIGNLAIFQTVFATIIGAIATYLGLKR
jgi:hypothetical protein